MLNEFLLFGRGLLRVAQERWDEAETDFREIGRRQEIWGVRRPVTPWRSACARVRLAVGDREGARELAADELELACIWNTPKAIAIATHARALTADGDEAIDGIAEAVTLLEGTPWRLDRAAARCDLGAALRRAGRRREAREALTYAMDEAHTCGAEPLAERAADELRASGARPRRRAISGVDALTPSELRVAALAATGQTNRAIAQQLFVTQATVETHLTRVYRKLDLGGRGDLTGALVANGRAVLPAD
jgi:DNA-binding CsgD family transcriptional regulator